MSATSNIIPYSLKQGSFQVDANGAANYHIPIDVPPGIAGVQPRLGLDYNHRQGNGICGVGWTLSGLSAITRTNAIMAIDNYSGAVTYSNNDRLALDGERMINITGDYWDAGAIYYSEVHKWKQIVAGNTPQDGFTVYMKNGEKWSYGTTPDSCIMAQGTNTVRVWALASIEDLNGNMVVYQYTATPVGGSADTGAYYISNISYTVTENSEGYFSVSFGYIPRADELITYQAASQIQTNYLLGNVTVLMGETVVRAYTPEYVVSDATQLSRINNVVITDGEGNALPAIQLQWQDVAAPSFDISQTSSQLLNKNGVVETIPVDANGDGITDIMQFYLGENNVLYVSTFIAINNNGMVTYEISNGLSGELGFYSENYGTTYQIFTGDVNGDGINDIIVAYASGDNNELLYFDVYINNGITLSQAYTTSTPDQWLGTQSWGFYPMDMNGNGLIDMVQVYVDNGGFLNINGYPSEFNDTAAVFGTTVYNNTQQQFDIQSVWPADVNGDGIVDLIILWKNTEQQCLSATSFITTSGPSGLAFMDSSVQSNLGNPANTQLSILPVDVNGDGMTDILQIMEDSGTFTLQSFYSGGDGSFISGPTSSFTGQSYTASQLYPMNLNGGAQANIVAGWLDSNNYLNFTVFEASPSGAFTLGSSGVVDQQFSQSQFSIGDATGSGKAGFIYTYTDGIGNINVWPFPSAGAFPDMVSNITDQLGNSIAIAYSPLTDTNVYTETAPAYPATTARRYPCSLSPAQYPIQQIIGQAMYVVSGYSMTNDAAINRFPYNLQYQIQYTNACIDLNGRGWMGFGSKTILDTSTGLMSVENYLQQFPYTGSVASISKYADSTYTTDPKVPVDSIVLMSMVVNTFQSVGYDSPGANSGSVAYDVQQTGKLSYHYDYGEEKFDFLTAQSYAYDNYGNQNTKAWLGYVSFVDPSGINNIGQLPSLTPLAANEIVYRYRLYQNNVLPAGWALGYMLYEKQTANSTDANIAVFGVGDYNLSACTYNDDTFTLATQSAWDDQNNCMLTTSFGYDGFGNKISETGPDGSVTTYTYETTYNTYLDTVTTPANEQGIAMVSSYGFDPRFGMQVGRVDANGFVYIIGLDSVGRKVAEQGPVPAGCSQADTNLCSTFITGSSLFATANVLTLNNVAYLNDGQSGIYIQSNYLQQFPTDSSRVYLSAMKYVDALNRETETAIESIPANGYSIVLTSYDANSNPVSKSLPFFSASPIAPQTSCSINYTYDVLGRIITLVSPGGADNQDTVTNTWDYAAGQIVTVTTAQGQPEAYVQVITSHLYNKTHQQTQSVIANDNNATTTFGYDALGRLVQTIDPQNIINTITYDALGRKVTYDNPDQNLQGGNANALTYKYAAANGKVQTITDAAGNSVTYSYDALGRITSQQFSDGREYKFIYDTATNGCMKTAAVSIYAQGGELESERTFAYDAYGNTVHEMFTIGADSYSTSYVFDPANRYVSQTYNDGSMLTRQYQYGLLASQQLGDVSLTYPLADYTANGNYSQMQYMVDNNPVLVAGYNYNAMGQVYGETLDNGANTPLLNFSYTFDQLNELTSTMELLSNTGQSYTYQNKKLIGVVGQGEGMPGGSYAYDSGNRILSKDNNSYTYNNSNFPVSISGNMSYSAVQDNCGRMTSRTVNGSVLNFDYDADNNLTNISSGGGVIRRMFYNESGRRLREAVTGGATTDFIGSGYKSSVNLEGDTTVTKYMYDQLGPVASIATCGSDTVVLLFRRDQKGNVTHVYSNAGVLLTLLAYDGYGMPTVISSSSAADGAPQYEGRILDVETGLFYFGARYYDPVTGTFLTPDSRLGGKHKLVAGVWNRFSFELNNPVNHVDPSGHMSIWAKIGIGAACVLLTVGAIALTPLTGGLSDAAVAAFDSSAAGAIGVDSATTGIEMADLSVTAAGDAGATAGADAGATVAADAGTGLESSSEAILRAVARVAIRAGVNALAGGVTGAMSGAGISGLTYLIDGGNSADGAWDAMGSGALSGFISGAVSGAVAGELTAAVNFSKYSTFTCIIIKGGISAAGDVAGDIAQSLIIDQQFPSASDLESTAMKSFFTGALFSDESIAAGKKYYYFRSISQSLNKNNEIGIEMTEITRKL